MAAGEPYALRLDMAEALARAGALALAGSGRRTCRRKRRRRGAPAAWGDVVLARKDVPTSYHLSVVVDDALQGVTDVVRGQDLFWSTSVHRLLQTLLGLPAPPYRHHRLMLDADGRKLSKSTAATALRELRAEGVTPARYPRKARTCRNGEWPPYRLRGMVCRESWGGADQSGKPQSARQSRAAPGACRKARVLPARPRWPRSRTISARR